MIQDRPCLNPHDNTMSTVRMEFDDRLQTSLTHSYIAVRLGFDIRPYENRGPSEAFEKLNVNTEAANLQSQSAKREGVIII
jgi:hypothetical protein